MRKKKNDRDLMLILLLLIFCFWLIMRNQQPEILQPVQVGYIDLAYKTGV